MARKDLIVYTSIILFVLVHCAIVFYFQENREKFPMFINPHKFILEENAIDHVHENGFFLAECDCWKHLGLKRELNKNRTLLDTSQCSEEATFIGNGQKVISYSLGLNDMNDKQFLPGVAINLEAMRQFYPGWFMRVYTNLSLELTEMCPLVCKYDELLLCDVRRLPKLGNLEMMNVRSWRFLPLGDPTVDIVLSRDLDSVLSNRERHAVAEWESLPDKLLHIMRDHPYHGIPILGGTWGAKNAMIPVSLRTTLQTDIIEKSKQDLGKNFDQLVIQFTLYVKLFRQAVAHDAYHCTEFGESLTLPFPTQREGREFVGDDIVRHWNSSGLPEECPKECRPIYGKNWLYC